MTWFSKFFGLLYIAYLDCEITIKNFAFLLIGMILGMFLLSIVSPTVEIPIEFMWVTWYNYMSFVNWGIIIIFITQYVISVIMVLSVLKVAYIYDNKSWGYVKSAQVEKEYFMVWVESFNTHLDRDAQEHDNLKEKHNNLIELEVKKLKG